MLKFQSGDMAAFGKRRYTVISNYNNDPLFRFLEAEGEGMRGSCRGPGLVSNPSTPENGCLSGRSLAMVYSPCQEFEGVYEPMAGLMAGTIFRELEKPFYGARRLK